MNYQELIDKITSAILDNLRVALKDYSKCDKTYKGYVTEIVMSKKDPTKRTNRYKIAVNGDIYTATSNISLNVGEFVWICIPCGNAQNAFVVTKS